jgi:hypothetical protein
MNTTIAVQVARMGEFHERCPVISNPIRALRPFVPFVFQSCPPPVSGPQEIEVVGHEHGVEPIEGSQHGIIVSTDVTHKLSTKAFP